MIRTSKATKRRRVLGGVLALTVYASLFALTEQRRMEAAVWKALDYSRVGLIYGGAELAVWWKPWTWWDDVNPMPITRAPRAIAGSPA